MPSKHNKRAPEITRRQFITKTAIACGAAAGASVVGAVFYSHEPMRRPDVKPHTFKNYRIPENRQYPKMIISRGTDPDKITRSVVDKLGGISRFIQPKDRVLIKPNVGWDRQPEQAANTRPEVVQAVAALCRDAGADQVWVTDVTINDPFRSFSRSGIEAAVKKAGAIIKYTAENDFVPTDLKGEILKVWPVSRFYHEVDKVINIPVVKHHSLSKGTIAMKNWYGILGGRRNRLHQDIHTSIADLALAVKPTLTIIDATRVLFRNGPTGGNLSDVSIENTIIAGTDEVALDSYSLRYLNIRADEVDYLKMAESRGLGTTQWQTLDPVEIEI